ncbi:tRNA (adenosine(37)-N6)-threonylcarbamoyltransferase complex dimerization subunit type 1 TsaB [PVC group bacterium]|nr:tRNA (adenosine(37)-N6)-threonylcarbamoyltransferase complex dimerization subunit type 1 TsaB [PVC group bacterium]
MLTLSIEHSTETASIALMNNADFLNDRSWTVTRGNPGELFSELDFLLESCKADIADIDIFAVGLGPGSFTGLRISLSAFKTLALPENKSVYGLSSAESIAFMVANNEGKPISTDKITIVGDARRDRLWIGEFTKDSDSIQQTGDFTLIPIAEFHDKVMPGTIVATPDWERLSEKLSNTLPPTVRLVDKAIIPNAKTIAELASSRIERGVSSAPLEPIYMHPPVFVEPRY